MPGDMGDSLPYVNVGTGRTVLDVAVGLSTTCAMLDNGTTKCWGVNTYGQLGMGDDTLPNIGDGGGEMGDPLVPLQVGTGFSVAAVSAGRDNILVLRDDGKVIVFGDNNNSQGVKADALRCVSMSIAMKKRMKVLQHDWFKTGIKKPSSHIR